MNKRLQKIAAHKFLLSLTVRALALRMLNKQQVWPFVPLCVKLRLADTKGNCY